MHSLTYCPKCSGTITRVPEDTSELRCLDCKLQWAYMGDNTGWIESEYTGQAQNEIDDAIKAYRNKMNIPSPADRTRGII